MISGAIQKGVPITVFRFYKVVYSFAETPKSAYFALPSLVRRTLPALMSYVSTERPVVLGGFFCGYVNMQFQAG